jgi:hypothetical protein
VVAPRACLWIHRASFCSVDALALPSSDVGVPLLFAVVVAWLSLATDVVLGSTLGSCCRVCDAPSRMLCRVGSGDRLGRLSVDSLPPLHIS